MILKHQIQVPSYELLGVQQATMSTTRQWSLTPIGEACVRTDLTAMHEVLGKIGYKDDEGIAHEVRFSSEQQNSDMLLYVFT